MASPANQKETVGIDDFMAEAGRVMRKKFDDYLRENGGDPDYWDEREKRTQGCQSIPGSEKRPRNQGRA